jgi:hypothetical protein
MAGLGESNAQYILQLPPASPVSEEHQRDALNSAIKLYNTPDDRNRVVAVNAMESLREARTQCAVCPGARALFTTDALLDENMRLGNCTLCFRSISFELYACLHALVKRPGGNAGGGGA